MYMEPAMSSAALLLVLLLLVCVAVIVDLRTRTQIMSNMGPGSRSRGALRRNPRKIVADRAIDMRCTKRKQS